MQISKVFLTILILLTTLSTTSFSQEYQLIEPNYQLIEPNYPLIEPTKTVLYFTADWCQGCQLQKPILTEITKKYTIGYTQQHDICVYDYDENKETAKKVGVTVLPYWALLVNNKIVKRQIGRFYTVKQFEDFRN